MSGFKGQQGGVHRGARSDLVQILLSPLFRYIMEKQMLMGFFLSAPKTQIFSYIMRISDHSNWVGSSISQDLTTVPVRDWSSQSGTGLCTRRLWRNRKRIYPLNGRERERFETQAQILSWLHSGLQASIPTPPPPLRKQVS